MIEFQGTYSQSLYIPGFSSPHPKSPPQLGGRGEAILARHVCVFVGVKSYFKMVNVVALACLEDDKKPRISIFMDPLFGKYLSDL